MPVAVTATDHFSLGANFHPQSSNATDSKQRATALAADGDVACESMTNNMLEYTTEYKYCGSDIKTDLGTFITNFGDAVGAGTGVSAKLITELEVTFEAGVQPTVRVTGETAGSNALSSGDTNTSDVSAAFPTSAGGVTVPTLSGVTLGTNASPVRLTLTARMNKVQAVGADGEHFATALITPTVDGTAEYLGVPTTYDPPTSWTTDSTEESDGNDDFDRATWTGHRNFTVK